MAVLSGHRSPARTVSIRSSLLRNILGLVLAISATVLVVMFAGARRAVEDLSAQLIDQSAGQAEESLRDFFDRVEGLARTAVSWSDHGLLEYTEPADLERFNGIFAPVLLENRQISSMMLGDDEGREYMLLRDFAGDQDYAWLNRITWAERGPGEAFLTKWDGSFAMIDRFPMEDAASYDGRTRPYYTVPGVGETVWTDPYYFFVTRDAGMTVSRKWRHPSGQVRMVAFDLLLMDLSRFTIGRHPTPHGRVFVLSRDGSLLGLPSDDRWADPEGQREALRFPAEERGREATADRAAVLRTPGELGLPVIEAAVETWRAGGTRPEEHFRFAAGGESWWGGFRRFELAGPELWIGVVAPESDLLGEARQQRNIVFGICGAAILVAVVLAVRTARRYSRPLEELARKTAQVRDLNLVDDVPVESRLREINQLAEANTQMMTALDSFAKYVPLELVRQLLRRGEVARIGGKTEELTVLFTDIQGFTNLAEGMDPADLTALMADYFSAMLEVLNDEGATVDKFIGDAIVAFWGAPEPTDRHASHGVRAVLRCRDLLRERNAEWQRRGLPPLRTRFGLCSGRAVVGNVGAPERLNYTVLGDTVNLASRLEGLNTRYGTEILASEAVVEATGAEFLWRVVDRVVVKGKERAVGISEPLATTARATAELRDLAQRYAAAFECYSAADFGEAARLLRQLLETDPDDGPASALLERCREYLESPPEDGWDGVTRFATK